MNSLKALKNGFDICVLGEQASGKSSLILHYLHQSFIPSDSSIEDLYTKVIKKGTDYDEVTILDASSLTDSYSSSKRKQVSNTESILFVYSIDNFESFQAIEEDWTRLRSFNKTLPPIVLVGNKCDLEGQRQVSYDEGIHLARTIGAIHFAECSAKRGVGINEAFQPLVTTILRSRKEGATAPVAFTGDNANFSKERRQSVKSVKSVQSAKSVKSTKSTKSVKSAKSAKSEKRPISTTPKTNQTRNIQSRTVHEPKSSSGCCSIT